MKATVASIVIAAAIILGAVAMTNTPLNSSDRQPTEDVGNVSIENGKQIITINVRGGYSPQISNAKADIPTVLRLVTKGTFDCSLAISIPAIRYRATLPQSGVTEVLIPPQKAGSSIQGSCAMGMYGFRLDFSA